MESIKRVSRNLEENLQYVNHVLPVNESFDVIQRNIYVGEHAAVLYFINGFANDETLLKIMDSMLKIKQEDMAQDVWQFSRKYIPYADVELLQDLDESIVQVLSGLTCLMIDGYEEACIIDCRSYPARSMEEPEKDKSLRGSRDGFVETIVWNTALIRRRIRNPQLIMEMKKIGETSKTDVALCYMKNRVDSSLLQNISERLSKIQVDALRMNQQSLAENLYKRKWFNPFPKFKYTERPDTAVACLLEGKIVLLVDNSPSAMILPTSAFDMIEEANDYYFPILTNIYLKAARVLITFLTVFLTPVFLLLMQNLNWLPEALAFVAVKDMVNVPLIYQLLILEISIDGLRLAALNTPNMLSTPLSVIAGLVMGEFSVNSGWFNSEVMLYMAFVAVANYTQPNFELGYALKFMRLQLLILTALLNWIGFVIGCAIVICSICFNKTISGKSYLNVKQNYKFVKKN